MPKLIDNKRKHLQKALSAAQRDQILLQEAKEDKETRRVLASSIRESSQSFNAAMQNISGSLSQLANGITRSKEMLSQAILVGRNQPPMNQDLFTKHMAITLIHQPHFNFNNSGRGAHSPGSQQTEAHSSHAQTAPAPHLSEECFYDTL